jgi:hypothetical protein
VTINVIGVASLGHFLFNSYDFYRSPYNNHPYVYFQYFYDARFLSSRRDPFVDHLQLGFRSRRGSETKEIVQETGVIAGRMGEFRGRTEGPDESPQLTVLPRASRPDHDLECRAIVSTRVLSIYFYEFIILYNKSYVHEVYENTSFTNFYIIIIVDLFMKLQVGKDIDGVRTPYEERAWNWRKANALRGARG